MRVVAIYARVSSEHEAQLSALENQIQYYDDIMSKHPDWVLYDRYVDEGKTGTSVNKRKNFLRMLDDAKDGCFDLIITREVSRFARNTVDTLQETRNLKAVGVEVWFIEDNIWSFNDEDGELRLTIMATLAQNESKKISTRVKAGQMISFKNGVPYGTGNILGYDKLPYHGPFVINEEQAKTVRMIYDLYLQGYGLTKIKNELEREVRRTATGKTIWDISTISRVLKNSFYCGIVTYRKFYSNNYLEQKHCVNKGEVEQITVKANHEPIVTEEEYNRVQEIMKLRSQGQGGYYRGDSRKDPNNYWESKVVCGCCGKSYKRVKYHTNADGTQQYAFQCRSTIKTGSLRSRRFRGLPIEGICPSVILPQWKLECVAYYIFANMLSKDVSIPVGDGIIPISVIDKYVIKVEVHLTKMVWHMNSVIGENKSSTLKKHLGERYIRDYLQSHPLYKKSNGCDGIDFEILFE